MFIAYQSFSHRAAKKNKYFLLVPTLERSLGEDDGRIQHDARRSQRVFQRVGLNTNMDNTKVMSMWCLPLFQLEIRFLKLFSLCTVQLGTTSRRRSIVKSNSNCQLLGKFATSFCKKIRQKKLTRTIYLESKITHYPKLEEFLCLKCRCRKNVELSKYNSVIR